MNKFETITNQVLREMAEETRHKKFVNIDTSDIIRELSKRIKENLYVLCIKCEEENKQRFDKYFCLDYNFEMYCEFPLCKKHIQCANEYN